MSGDGKGKGGSVGTPAAARGECYYGQPDQNLPNMLVVNQDVLVTAGDLIIGSMIPVVGDIPLTILSIYYDANDVLGHMPNIYSLGINASGFHILHYLQD